MSGSISLSLSQQLDSLGAPLRDGRLYFFAAGTSTPQSAYRDVDLTLPYPNPITLDAAGRVPAFYLADGQIKIRLTNAAGVTQVAADNLLVVGASSGSGSAPSVDATTVLQTGDLKVRYGTGTHAGWVRANGRTIGSALSGASERANLDCQELFEFLWGEDPNLSVSGGRGANAAADWAADKTIALPDWRGRTLAGLDDMGASPAGVLTTATTGFGPAVPTTLGQGSGQESKTLETKHLPPYTPAGTNGSISVGSGGLRIPLTNGNVGNTNVAGGGPKPGPDTDTSWSSATSLTGSAPTFTGTAQGGTSTAFATLAPTRLATIYIKL